MSLVQFIMNDWFRWQKAKQNMIVIWNYAAVHCHWVRVIIAVTVTSSSAVHLWTMRCWGMELRIISFVQQSVACVRISRMVQMLLANMNRCVLHLLIPGSVNCWRLVHLVSSYLPFCLWNISVSDMIIQWPVFRLCYSHSVKIRYIWILLCYKWLYHLCRLGDKYQAEIWNGRVYSLLHSILAVGM